MCINMLISAPPIPPRYFACSLACPASSELQSNGYLQFDRNVVVSMEHTNQLLVCMRGGARQRIRTPQTAEQKVTPKSDVHCTRLKINPSNLN